MLRRTAASLGVLSRRAIAVSVDQLTGPLLNVPLSKGAELRLDGRGGNQKQRSHVRTDRIQSLGRYPGGERRVRCAAFRRRRKYMERLGVMLRPVGLRLPKRRNSRKLRRNWKTCVLLSRSHCRDSFADVAEARSRRYVKRSRSFSSPWPIRRNCATRKSKTSMTSSAMSASTRF